MAKVETKKISDLLPDPNNVNKHTQRGHALVENSIRRRGVGRGILAAGKNTEKPIIMAGNLTHEKARDAGIDEVIFVHTTGNQLVVTVRDDLDPTSPEAIALGIEDNETAKQSYSPDLDVVAALAAGDNAVLASLRNEDKVFNSIISGMKIDEGEPVDAEPQIDRAAELQVKWQTCTGQLWKLGEHRLLIGDCTVRENVERLMGGERADCVCIDPPYGMNYKGREFGKDGIENDGENFDEILKKANELFPIDNGVISVWFGASRQDRMFLAMSGRTYHRSLFMYKPNGLAYTWHGWILTTEVCHLFSCGKPKWIEEKHHHDTYTFDYSERPDSDVDHPNVKPLSILEDIMGKIDAHIVYDCFAGSGTTIIAAHNLNRRCYAMEISDKYGAVILERFEQATGIQPELVETV